MQNIITNTKLSKIIENNFEIKTTKRNRVDYKSKICVKPWGHEFLIYESKKIGIWFLKIINGHATSLHTHFNKDTFLIVLELLSVIAC